MNKIHTTFNRPRVLLPVVHACSMEQVQEQTAVARENGADGVFVINQGGLNAYQVIDAALAETQRYPDWFVGVNLLAVRPHDIDRLLPDPIRGLWSDNLFTPSTRFAGLYFGGAAFKGQAPVRPEDYPDAAVNAVRAGADVVTTSGPRTGSPPLPTKAAAMRKALGPNYALALASGVTPENVHMFLPYVDAFLVATGIEAEFGRFDPVRLRQLAELIHAYNPT